MAGPNHITKTLNWKYYDLIFLEEQGKDESGEAKKEKKKKIGKNFVMIPIIIEYLFAT